ncbi:unnamed protein product [Pipistrellus nathusii]|uniref:Uncharacterized protein n=1 Tax=Pipistrellus nathusii TaxID=59473 RepID=A0ABN9Z108_PIPNA
MQGGRRVGHGSCHGEEGRLQREEGWVCSLPLRGKEKLMGQKAQVKQRWPPRKRKQRRAGLLQPTTAGLGHVWWPGGLVGGVEAPTCLHLLLILLPGKRKPACEITSSLSREASEDENVLKKCSLSGWPRALRIQEDGSPGLRTLQGAFGWSCCRRRLLSPSWVPGGPRRCARGGRGGCSYITARRVPLPRALRSRGEGAPGTAMEPQPVPRGRGRPGGESGPSSRGRRAREAAAGEVKVSGCEAPDPHPLLPPLSPPSLPLRPPLTSGAGSSAGSAFPTPPRRPGAAI